MPSDPSPPDARNSSATQSAPPASPGPLKRPRYLLVALIVALVFGAGCWTEGCTRLAFYRGEADQVQTLHADITNDADRERAEALYRRFTDIADASRGRAIPLAAAIFVLGAALLALASRGISGKTATPNALVQLVAVQAILVVVAYFLTRDLYHAELEWDLQLKLSHLHATRPADQYEQMVPMMHAVGRVALPGWLVVRTFLSALILVALTRPRAREFFRAASRKVSEG